jgi:hypothetical protein
MLVHIVLPQYFVYDFSKIGLKTRPSKKRQRMGRGAISGNSDLPGLSRVISGLWEGQGRADGRVSAVTAVLEKKCCTSQESHDSIKPARLTWAKQEFYGWRRIVFFISIWAGV